jgi:hypothetical protein
VYRALGPLLGSITRCANAARPAADEGNESGWFMEFVLALDPSSGSVTSVTPHGDTTRSKPELVSCVRSVLMGQALAPNDPPPEIEVDFVNAYSAGRGD